MKPKDLREIALKTAGETAGLLRDYREEKEALTKIEEGKDTIKADKIAEDYIIDTLVYEGFHGLIVSEEIGVKEIGKDEIIAIIDPLDGSRNYIHGITWCAISIAFAKKRKKSTINDIIAGVVQPIYSPYPFSFYKDGGVYWGNSTITREKVITNLTARKDIMYAVYEDEPKALEVITTIYQEKLRKGVKPKIRSLGSASLEITYTSLGFFNAFIDSRSKLRIVDIAASIGILKELGGYYSKIDSKPLSPPLDRIEPIGSLVASLDKNEVETITGIYKDYIS